MTADLIALKEAVERGENSIGVEASRAFPPAQYAECLRAYGEWGQRPSLDAAVSLLGAALPGWGWTAGPWGARVFLYSDNPKWDGSKRQEIEMVNAPARALLIAILSALIDAKT